jgi:raffinose/stachyose/melibiose transport system permease protein
MESSTITNKPPQGVGRHAGRVRRRGRARGSVTRIPLFWAAPAMIFVVAFVYICFFAGSWYAFTDWNGLAASANWVGLENFINILRNDGSRAALAHTVEITAVFVILVNAVGLVLALALNRTLKSRNYLRALFFAPVILSPLAVSYIWQFIFSFNGPLNGFLGALNLDSWQRDWLGDPNWALWTIVVVFVWQFAGLTMAFYLAGLQNVPEEIDEAAAVDGASTWYRLRRITLPLLAPSMTVSVTLMTILGLRVFDQVMALTSGGPAGATETLATEVYRAGFVFGRFGYSAAFALMLTVLVVAVSLVQLFVLRRREERL